jgi:hypothetical protein
LHEIVVRIEGGFIRMVLHWQGGDHTALQLKINGAGQHRWNRDLVPFQGAGEIAANELAALVGIEDFRSAIARERFLERFEAKNRRRARWRGARRAPRGSPSP